jgi:hypothetical protein
VDAEIAIGGFQQLLQVVEAQDLVYRERADDCESNAFVNERIEFQALRSMSSRFAGGPARSCGSTSCAIGIGLSHDDLPKIEVLQKVKSWEGCDESDSRKHKPLCAAQRVFPVGREKKNQSSHHHQDHCDLKNMRPWPFVGWRRVTRLQIAGQHGEKGDQRQNQNYA